MVKDRRRKLKIPQILISAAAPQQETARLADALLRRKHNTAAGFGGGEPAPLLYPAHEAVLTCIWPRTELPKASKTAWLGRVLRAGKHRIPSRMLYLDLSKQSVT